MSELRVIVDHLRLNYSGPAKLTEEVREVVLDEVNVYELIYKQKSNEYIVSGDVSEKNQDLIAGKAREIVRAIQRERKKLETTLDEKVNVTLEDWPKEFEEEIKRKAMIENLQKGPKFVVTRK